MLTIVWQLYERVKKEAHKRHKKSKYQSIYFTQLKKSHLISEMVDSCFAPKFCSLIVEEQKLELTALMWITHEFLLSIID